MAGRKDAGLAEGWSRQGGSRGRRGAPGVGSEVRVARQACGDRGAPGTRQPGCWLPDPISFQYFLLLMFEIPKIGQAVLKHDGGTLLPRT